MGVPVDLVVPVKELDRAKTRLVGASGALPGSAADRRRAHRALALALARDTVAAALGSGVRRVAVVTADARAASALVGLGTARSPGDGPGSGHVVAVADPGGGLNAAIRGGVEHLRHLGRTGGEQPAAVAVLQADLPALRPEELDAALWPGRQQAGETGLAFVADRAGTGTTLLVGGPAADLAPRFGPGSAAAHQRAGALRLEAAWPGLRADVDTPADLARVRSLGAGPATRAWPLAPPPDPGSCSPGPPGTPLASRSRRHDLSARGQSRR